jgi:hypothetical protein
MAVIAGLRLAALRWEIQVPAFELATTQEHPAATDAPPPRR